MKTLVVHQVHVRQMMEHTQIHQIFIIGDVMVQAIIQIQGNVLKEKEKMVFVIIIQ